MQLILIAFTKDSIKGSRVCLRHKRIRVFIHCTYTKRFLSTSSGLIVMVVWMIVASHAASLPADTKLCDAENSKFVQRHREIV